MTIELKKPALPSEGGLIGRTTRRRTIEGEEREVIILPPLEGVHVELQTIDFMARITLNQFYFVHDANKEEEEGEGEGEGVASDSAEYRYEFPLDPSSSVCSFEVWYLDKKRKQKAGDQQDGEEEEEIHLKAKVKDWRTARKNYLDACKKGDKTFLLERRRTTNNIDEVARDVFSVWLGNLPKRTPIRVKLVYQTELNYSAPDILRFSLPLSVAPRYTPPSSYISSFRSSCVSTRCCSSSSWDIFFDFSRSSSSSLISFGGESGNPLPFSLSLIADISISSSSSSVFSIPSPPQITGVSSPSHPDQLKWVPTSSQTGCALLVLETSPLERDFILEINSPDFPLKPKAVFELFKSPVTPSSTLASSSSSSSTPFEQDQQVFSISAALSVTFIPFFKLDELEGEKQEFVFVVDCSGSMAGNKIHFVREALPLFLKALPTGCRFNILKFGTKFKSLFPLSSSEKILGMGIYDEENIGRAMDYVKNLKASMGGTELLGPLRALFSPVPSPSSSFFSSWFSQIDLTTSLPPSSSTSSSPRFRRVFVLTDGEVTNTDQVIREVSLAHQTHHHWSLFSIGVGSSASRGLVEGISRGGRGICEFLEDTERMEKPIMKMLKVAVQPSLTNVDIKWLPPSSSSSTTSSSFSLSSLLSTLRHAIASPSAPTPTAPPTGSTLSEEEELLLLEQEMGMNPPTLATGAPTSRIPTQVHSPSPSPLSPSHSSLAIARQAPSRVPPVFSEEKVTLYSLVEFSQYFKNEEEAVALLPKRIKITATSPDGPLKLSIPLQKIPTVTSLDSSILSRLAARSLIQDLEDETGEKGSKEEEELIVELGKKYSLASKYTSFIVTEEKEKKEDEEEEEEKNEKRDQSWEQETTRRKKGILKSISDMRKIQREQEQAKRREARRKLEISRKMLQAQHLHTQSMSLQMMDPHISECMDVCCEISECLSSSASNLNDLELELRLLALEEVATDSATFSALNSGLSALKTDTRHLQSLSSSLSSSPSSFSSSSSSSTTSSSSSNTLRKDMNTLVALQKVDGRFVLSSELLRVVGQGSRIPPSKDQFLQILTYPHLGTSTLSSLTSSELEDVWSTLLVISHFETRLLDFSEEWELIVNKSKKWVELKVKQTTTPAIPFVSWKNVGVQVQNWLQNNQK